jgi:pyruvate/2-oxoglutarate dehydrogenase complex dihydrolipoamide dehydrogenase (E3) component
VKPADWVNPRPKERYQLVVIGGGPAGLVCAAAAAALGATVALVERDLLGGDCLNVGCVPSKTLLRAARAAAESRRAQQFGMHTPQLEIDFAAVMQRVRRVRAELAPNDSAERFRSLGVDVFLGEGRFTDSDRVEVNGTKFRFGRCVIATGSRPAVPDLPGLAESRWFTNESIFTLTDLPQRLLVIGSGSTGCELGQAFARLGSRVTLVARSQVLRGEDPEAAQLVEDALRADGIDIVPQTPTDLRGFDAVLVATGRIPNIEGLNLEAAGVQFHPKAGIAVDRYLRTTNARIFAAGDVCAVPFKLTNAADAMARLAVRNALMPRPVWAAFNEHLIPRCTFTDPELGHIGTDTTNEVHSPRQLLRVGYDDLDRAACDASSGFLKVKLARGTDRLIGATVVGSHAGELVGTLSVAMTNQIGLKQLATTNFPYPTFTEAIRKLADQYNRTRLTPRAKRLIGTWLRWFR